MFKTPFSFNGRIRRLEYGLSNIIYIVGIFIISILLRSFDDPKDPSTNVLMIVLWIPLGWFMLAQGAKRCHDRGNSGAWQIIPFYGFWMLFAPGIIGRNVYGPNPKGLNDDYTVEEDNAILSIDNIDEDGIIKQ